MFSFIKNRIRFFFNRRHFPKSVFGITCSVSKSSKLGEQTVLFDNVSIQNSCIGDYTYIQKDSTVLNATVGRYCSIASNVTIGLAEHPMHYISTSPIFYDNSQPLPAFFVNDVKYRSQPETIIGHDVWIGQGAMIKSGITIGHGAVLAAGTIVTKDVAPYSVVAGVPARQLKWRFDEEIRALLLESNWWDLSAEDLRKMQNLFHTPTAFCNAVKSIRSC